MYLIWPLLLRTCYLLLGKEDYLIPLLNHWKKPHVSHWRKVRENWKLLDRSWSSFLHWLNGIKGIVLSDFENGERDKKRVRDELCCRIVFFLYWIAMCLFAFCCSWIWDELYCQIMFFCIEIHCVSLHWIAMCFFSFYCKWIWDELYCRIVFRCIELQCISLFSIVVES